MVQLTPERPLAGLVAIEIGHSVAAPFAGQVLADLGAEVIKIEQPGCGDDARWWGPPFWYGASATFQSINRNKHSLEIDFKDPDALDGFRELVRSADIVVQNMRPGLVAQLGIDAETLRAQQTELIYCNLGSFGEGGPLADRPGYDPLVQGFSGIMSVTGEPGGAPVRVGPSIVDMGAGMWCVIGILAALRGRTETGQGCTVDASLFETALAWMTVPIANAMASGCEPGRSGSETPMLAPYKAYQASDGHVIIAAGNDNLFRKLCAGLGRPDLADDPRFQANADRVANRIALNAAIEETVGGANSVHWVEVMARLGVPCAPIQNVGQVIEHPQTRALGMVQPSLDGNMQFVALPVRFDGRRPALRSDPPDLGEANGRIAATIAQGKTDVS